ncbi:crotonobetainyl-CoA:carnitine CoA-transferase CaiB-like acyl-CoA transferase [Mycobacterium sp. OAS707]|uniref:CaiB/BaiF CoA-transferase family protein n=1 Tax=Mycobacterium sp. OAS707 TaxID=2663822 RepID=UPI00178A6EEA|nr:crotonobetainyl-CoA:carnitine CoA-transferase CaiB-like acyl-CoA transferase [Mycobacterium sp. OAS707]
MRKGLLEGVRVLDSGGADSDAVSRLFADLGADVLKIEPPQGSPARQALPSMGGVSIPFALQNANKRGAVLDPGDATDRERLIELAGSADIVVDDGTLAAYGTSCAALAEQFEQLVAVSVTDFGATGPHASWQATDAVLYAMSTALSRSGPTSGTPVLPPLGIASATAAVQAAWAALAAFYHRLRCGTGEYIDFSRYEAVVQSLDPPFGSEGQAAVGLKKSNELWRGRPRNQQLYPIFACRDGYVRICLLSPRQWRGMRAWLGQPEQFADPKFDTIAARYAASRELNEALAELCDGQTMADLVTEGQRRGVPIAAVLTPAQALSSEHFQAVGALVDVEPGLSVPVGPFVVDGAHAGYTDPAPSLGADQTVWATERPERTAAGATTRPFEGMRILDLGVIVAGGELGRLFADLGAEVIKIESAAYPDGLRQTPPGMVMSRSWALTHRNEYSLGLDLRHPSGGALFERLVAGADAVFANFKPGTLASLGFSYQRLRELNPRIVLAESSAFGATGPWSERMGYGPLVRATTGVTWLWTSKDAPLGSFYDATTIFPDHVSARLTAVAALAALIGRDHTGSGAHVHISQAEAAVNQLATSYVADEARAAGQPIVDDPAVHVVCPCEGDDEWCVISLRDDSDRAALSAVTGGLEPADWTRTRDKTDVAHSLQRAGVPAAPMYRAVDVLADPQLTHRNMFSDMAHPLFDAPMPTETGPAPYIHIPPAELRPAPMPGEHTIEICQKLLSLDADETDRLLADGVLFTHQERPN